MNNNSLFKELRDKIEQKIKEYKRGRLLPSELRKEIWKAIHYYDENGSITIEEPCNCDSHIRHNNGGNYHDIISIRQDEEKHFQIIETTSELEPPAKWFEINNPYDVIIKYGEWL